MEWYVKLIVYFAILPIVSIALYQIDFNKFMRVGRKQLSIAVWAILSIALGYLVGSLFIEIGDILIKAKGG